MDTVQSKVQTNLKTPIKVLLLFPMILLVVGIYHGLMQVLYRAGIIQSASFLGLGYYQGLTLHGVINAVLLTTFFAVAYGHFVVSKLTAQILQIGWVWASTVFMLLGSVLAAITILTGQSTVLYTFYPPLMAHPLFYIGLTLAVVGSWLAFYVWIAAYLNWRQENPGKKTPMAVVGVLATFFIWQLATLPVAFEILFLLLPWSLGLTGGVNALLARTLFWFFGHPLVYFWLMPAYTMYYTSLPKVAGGKLYSDFAGRFVFLSFCVLSAPLGLHHQFADGGISVEWKGLHTVLTSLVAIPSIMTAFTIAASLEHAGRSRGGKGLFAWWKALPFWDQERWLFSYLICGLFIFIFGGATGVVNASYNLNNVVHNTAWVPAHFHLTVAGPVFLAILGMSLLMMANCSDKKVPRSNLVLSVPYLWGIGVCIMSSGLFLGGLRGEPRRTNLGLTYLNKSSELYYADWIPSTYLAMIGGVLMTISMLVFFYVFVQIMFAPKVSEEEELPISESYHDEQVGFVLNFKPWVVAGFIAVFVAYYGPIKEVINSNNPEAKGYSPNSPLPVRDTND